MLHHCYHTHDLDATPAFPWETIPPWLHWANLYQRMSYCCGLHGFEDCAELRMCTK